MKPLRSAECISDVTTTAELYTAHVPVLISKSLSEANIVFSTRAVVVNLPLYSDCRETCSFISLMMFLINVRIGRNSYFPHGLLGIPSPINKQTYLFYWIQHNNSAWFLFWREVGNCIVVEGQSLAAMKRAEDRSELWSRPSQQSPSGGKTEFLNKNLIFCSQKILYYWDKR
jgi:hypothetical protein